MIRAILRNAGISPRRFLASCRGWGRYLQERAEFRSIPGADSWVWGRELPILTEWDDCAGSLGAYFHQDLTIAQWIHEDSPQRHIDAGSRIDGFIGHLAVFREVEVLDIRPMTEEVPGVRFHQLDLMEPLAAEWLQCTDSLSCLHTIEHFGLGRYGDPLDPQGHERGVRQLQAMVRPGGRLYLSTPIGPPRVEFNAHRIFAASTVFGWFDEGWAIDRLAVLDDDLRMINGPSRSAANLESHFGCQTGLLMLVAKKAF